MTNVSTYKTDKETTISTIQKQNKFETIVTSIISLLVFIAFGYVAIMGIFQTSIIDPAKFGYEVILYNADSVVLNIAFIALFAFIIVKMQKTYNFFAKINIKYFEIGIGIYAAIIALIWVVSVSSIPAADSYNIFETASNAAKGDLSSLNNGSNFYNKDFYSGLSYYTCYPFQLGFVFLCEIVYRIFGSSTALPMEIINALCVGGAYIAIAKITRILFNKRSVEFISIMFLAGCIQPLLFCSFAYGNIIGMCCAVWASYFLIKYFKTNKYLLLIPCAVLLVLSTIAKYNNMIYLVAFVVMLIIHTVKAKKWQSIAFALAICVATVGASNLIIMSYEARSGAKLSSGVSQTMYLDMGLNESSMAPGWYNGKALALFIQNYPDTDAASKMAKSEIDTRLSQFSSSPSYALEFFGNKILSQWNEPSFESVWVSQVKSHYYPTNSLANSVYQGGTGQFLSLYFNFYMQIIYLLFAVGIYFLFANKKSDISTILLPLVLLGAFGYHMLFEGKSQYVLTYIILLIPTASYALSCLLNNDFSKTKALIKKLKTIPNQDDNSHRE